MDDRDSNSGASLAGSHPAGSDSTPAKTHSVRNRFSFFIDPLVSTTQRAMAQPGRFLLVVFVILFFGVGIWILSWRAYGWHHLEAGKRCLEADHCREALDHFQTSLEIWPEDAATLFLAARAARRVGDFEAADRYLTQCQAAQSMVEAAAFERVLLRAAKGEIDAVGGFCEALLQQDHPDSPLILEALAQGNLTMLRFADASGYLDRWLETAPDHPHALFLKGRLQFQASNSQEALSLLRRSVELDPDRDDSRLLLAGLHLDLGQAQEALPHLEAVQRHQPNNILAQARLAQALVMLGRQEEAIHLLDEVLQKRPDLASALLERGKLALRDGELEKAEAWLKRACKRDPGNRAAHYQLLQCLKQRGNEAEARVVHTRLEQIDQDTIRMREIVTILLPQRRYNPDLQAELGELFLRAGATTEGSQWLYRALEVAPRHAGAHRALAKHYQSLGQFGQAQQHRALGGVTDPVPAAPKKSKEGE